METMIRPSHVLIIRTDHMGDMLLTLPAVLALKAVHPASRVSVLASPSNVEVARRFSVIHAVEIDEVHAKEARRKCLHGLFGLIRRLVQPADLDAAGRLQLSLAFERVCQPCRIVELAIELDQSNQCLPALRVPTGDLLPCPRRAGTHARDGAPLEPVESADLSCWPCARATTSPW